MVVRERPTAPEPQAGRRPRRERGEEGMLPQLRRCKTEDSHNIVQCLVHLDLSARYTCEGRVGRRGTGTKAREKGGEKERGKRDKGSVYFFH